jgi:mRNA interferase RelE/StbE
LAQKESWEVVLTKPAEKAYDRMPTALQDRIDTCFEELEKNPHFGPNIKALTGQLQGILRYRVGDWRVIYRLNAGKRYVEIIAILPRGDAY